ncbi:MAG: metallophosphoesterase [Myxococcales bacterium]|nr:metallophosphoesterase [Myxococcales bacterium]
MIWRRRLFLALFISAFGLGGGCRCSHPAGSDAPTNGQRTPLADAGLVDGSQLLVPSGPTSDVSQRPGMLSPKAEVTILAQPAQLRVLQSTHVTLQAKSPAGRKLHYAWTVDGKKQPQDTPLLVVRFDGRRDARIQLQAWDESGYKRVVERLIPRERLKVVPMAELESTMKILTAIPPGPHGKEGDFRFAVISDSNGSYGSIPQGEGVPAAVRQLVESIKPRFVVHNGDMIAGQKRGITREQLLQMWESYHQSVTLPLERAGIPLIPVPGNHDSDANLPDRAVYIEQWKERPPTGVNMISDRYYPLHYSFTYQGSYFVVLDSIAPFDKTQLSWLRRELRRGRIYKHRFVFSHLPFERFLDTDYGTLRHKFELYEALIKYDVTTFFSAHYEVYYKGKYGDLNVVSTGILAGTCRKLIGQEECQGQSFVVTDVTADDTLRIFAVRGPSFTSVFDDFLLPDKVGSYSRSY